MQRGARSWADGVRCRPWADRVRSWAATALACGCLALTGGCSLLLDFDEGGSNNPGADGAPADAGPVGDGGDGCVAYEPNDQINDAIMLEPGSYSPLGICPAGDRDFFSFTVDGTQDVTIEALFTNSAGMDLEMRLYDGTGMVIDRSESFDSDESIVRSAAEGNLLAAGTYIIEMYGFNNTDVNSYVLNLDVTAP